MGFLDALKGLFGGKGGESGDPQGRYFYVRCNACGEKIRVRVNMSAELSQEYSDDDEPAGYSVEKAIIGSKCFRTITLNLQFDRGKRVVEQKVQGGVIITKAEYEQTQ